MRRVSFILFGLGLPLSAYAHGGPEIFFVIWGILLLPAIIMALIVPRGYKTYWALGGILCALASVFFLADLLGNRMPMLFIFIPYILIPFSIWYRISHKNT